MEEFTASTLKVTCPLTEEVQLKIEEGIRAAAQKYHVPLGQHETFVFDPKIKRTGNRPIKGRTTTTYGEHYRQLWRFLAIIGDYESMLMLHVQPTVQVPAMKIQSLQLFLKLKRQHSGSPLLDDDEMPIYDINGKQVICDGGWKAPNKASQFQSAVSVLHRAHGHTSDFIDECDECKGGATEDARFRGCVMHANMGGGRLYRRGNPTRHELFLNTAAEMRNLSKGYEEKGDSQLTPKDLRAIRRYCLATGTLCGLQTWLIIIIGCKTFLRPDEDLTIQVSDFFPQLFARVGDRIVGLCVQVMGKCDQNYRKNWLWADDECPDLCPVRPLLIYLFLSGMKKGSPLFPSAEELNGQKPGDGIYKTELQYRTFLPAFKKLVARVLPDQDLRVGLQMMRKTAYLLGIWGGGEWGELKTSARHKTDKHAATYRRDATALMELADTYKDPENKVSKWKPIHCADISQSASTNNQSTASDKPIDVVANEFIRETLGILKGHKYEHSIPFLINQAEKYVVHKSADEKLEEFARKTLHLDGEKLQQMLDIVSESAYEKYKEWRDASTTYQPPQYDVPIIDATTASKDNSKKRKRGGDKEIEERKSVATLPLPERIKCLKKIVSNAPTETEQLTQAAKSFLNRTARPVVRCLANHFNDDDEKFCAHWKCTFKMKFGAECCDGNGARCGKGK
jgi:hypothetical protein